jgi:hypothetical protein
MLLLKASLATTVPEGTEGVASPKQLKKDENAWRVTVDALSFSAVQRLSEKGEAILLLLLRLLLRLLLLLLLLLVLLLLQVLLLVLLVLLAAAAAAVDCEFVTDMRERASQC